MRKFTVVSNNVTAVVGVIGIFFIMCSLLGISDNQTYTTKGKVIIIMVIQLRLL